MPIKKSLKIAGAILLAFFILYLGLMIVLSGLGKKSPLPPRQGLNIYDGSGVGVSGIFRPGAPSAKQSGGFSGDIAPDSDMGVRRDAAVSPTAAAIDKKIIKTGNLSLKVEQAETAAESIANIAKSNQGEVASSNFYESVRGVKSGSITVRVPYRNFEAAFNEIKKVSTQVVSESTSAQDITETTINQNFQQLADTLFTITPAMTQIALKITGTYNEHGWLLFNASYRTDQSSSHVIILRDDSSEPRQENEMVKPVGCEQVEDARLEREREIVRGLKARLGALLEAAPYDSCERR